MSMLRERVRKVLESIKTLGAGETFEKGSAFAALSGLKVITSLAEGADRIVAEEGLASGYSLHCALPFCPREYEKDFQTEGSRHNFRFLLSLAGSVQVLMDTFSADQRAMAYAKAGQEVLKNSDILIAIWDGNPEQGLGGTAQIVREAMSSGIPVVWINAHRPHEVRLLPPTEQRKNSSHSGLLIKLTQALYSEYKPDSF